MLNPKPPYGKFVQLDGEWYEVTDGEHTTTGLVIPPLTPWVRELPEGATLADRDVFGDLGRAGQKTEAQIKALTTSKAKAKK